MSVRILNIAIVVVALVLSAFLVKRFFFKPAQDSNYQIAADARLIINGLNWSDADRTVLLALAKDCEFCSDSAEFYRRLAAGITSQPNTRLIALFSTKDSEGEAYLKQLQVPIREVHYVSLSSLGIKNVPTVAILDRNGVVTDMWVGKLSPFKESALMLKLKLEDTGSRDKWSIDEARLARKVANKEPLLLLDIRERANFAMKPREGARNIPLDELSVRAQNELPRDHTIVIYGYDPSEMDLAYSILDTQGFSNVFVFVHNETSASKQSP